MRKFKMGLITLAASAAFLVPAGSAVASTQSTSNGASSSLGCVLVCFDIYTGDILSHNNVSVNTAANVCGVQVVQLTALGIGQIVKCSNGKTVQRVS